MSTPLRERSLPTLAPRPHLTVVPRPRRFPRPKLVLAALYGVAVAYHWLNSRGHVSPVVFGDELFYSKLAQSLVAGDGFSIRGEQVFFPAPLAVFAQAPAWLFDSTATALTVAKTINAALMSLAVFPVYAIARRVAQPALALVAATAAVAGPALVYHGYLLSEALAYPVFFLAVATMLRAIERPSRRMELAVIAVSLVACLTRIQFVVLPLVYLLAAPLAARSLRRHRLSLAGLALLVSLPLLTGGLVLGTYSGAAFLDFAVGDVLGWWARTATVLPFAAGWLVVPGALFGLVLAARARSAVGVFCALLVPALVLEAALISAADAGRLVERYVIYVAPLLFVAFLAYVELGAPHRKLYAASAVVLGLAAALYPFPAEAGDVFAFDSPTHSGYAQVASWWGHANAATLFAAVPLLGSIVLAVVGLRRRHAAATIAAAAAALLLVSGIPAYAGDRAVTRGTLEHRAGSPPDWLDRNGLGPADYLQLPGGSAHYGWVLEAWNREFRRPVHLGRGGDWFAESHARIELDGRLLVDGRPAAGTLVVNDFGTAIELDGEVVVRPRAGLTAYRLAPNPRVRLLAEGLMFDRWAAGIVTVRSWPQSRGLYVIRLTLPAGHGERTVTLSTAREKRVVELAGGTSQTVQIPAKGALRIETNVTHLLGAGTADARLVGVRIPTLVYRRKP